MTKEPTKFDKLATVRRKCAFDYYHKRGGDFKKKIYYHIKKLGITDDFFSGCETLEDKYEKILNYKVQLKLNQR